jgi:hypothetical protein
MINWQKVIPKWGGTIVEPSETKKDEGFLVGDRPPAFWENWFRKANEEAHEETREIIENHLEAEMPHIMDVEGTNYYYGLRQENGFVQFVYEEV